MTPLDLMTPMTPFTPLKSQKIQKRWNAVCHSGVGFKTTYQRCIQ